MKWSKSEANDGINDSIHIEEGGQHLVVDLAPCTFGDILHGIEPEIMDSNKGDPHES
jgi:hypothetical protein